MGLESATYINGLVETNPTSSDNANQGDNHLRLIKAAIKATFPNITGPVTATQATLNAPYLPLGGGTLTGGLSGTTGTFSGAVSASAFTGNASTATALQTARTINGVSFNGSANISFGTDSVAEGTTNLYFSNARARAAISATGDITYNSTTGVISFSASAAPVTSVAGKTGAVTLAIADTAGLQTALDGKAPLTGTGASGTWPINIGGNAATASSCSFASSASTATSATTATTATTANGLNSSNSYTMAGLTVNGAITATGDITAFSDSRTKMNIETITEALYKVKALRGVSYISKFNMEERIGVVAQEVERVVPEVVHTHANGLKSVAYQNLVGLLIEAIKALELRVAELESA